MTDEAKDMFPSEDKLPLSLDQHLRTIMADKELNSFREQLPAEFLSDAMEGLNHVKDGKQLESALEILNRQMHRQIANKRLRKRRTSIWTMSWFYWIVIIIFLLCFAGYFVIHMLLRP
ncbi:MAG: hypothetical protein M3N30_02420 [Bacteroidota bacterium]|nr:hypothetical protein [Bacteroidota bacterium]